MSIYILFSVYFNKHLKHIFCIVYKTKAKWSVLMVQRILAPFDLVIRRPHARAQAHCSLLKLAPFIARRQHLSPQSRWKPFVATSRYSAFALTWQRVLPDANAPSIDSHMCLCHQVQLPRYLKGLPLPRTFSGFLKLKQDEWMYLAPLLVTIAILFYSLFFSGKSDSKSSGKLRVNRSVKLEKDKVVDFMDVTDVEELITKGKGKCLVCRCWKSKKFPLCDGSHVKHNKETGDNVGPLVLQQKEDKTDKSS